MMAKTMMWRTTYVLGASGIGGALTYVAFLLGTAEEHGTTFRVVAASTLLLAAVLCLLDAFRAMRRAEPVRPGRSQP